MAETDVVYPRIDAARTIVESEIATAEAEADAFRRFVDRIRRLETATKSMRPAHVGSPATTVRGVSPDAVRAAYEETVLSMDHYGRDYGEPLLVNVAAELGAPVGELVRGDQPLSSVQRGVVETAAERALEERRVFRRTLEGELESLGRTRDRLGEIERALLETGDASTRLRELRDECRALASDRQRAIRRRPNPNVSGIGETSLVAFLYGDCDFRHPALAEIADVATRIVTTEGRTPGPDVR